MREYHFIRNIGISLNVKGNEFSVGSSRAVRAVLEVFNESMCEFVDSRNFCMNFDAMVISLLPFFSLLLRICKPQGENHGGERRNGTDAAGH